MQKWMLLLSSCFRCYCIHDRVQAACRIAPEQRIQLGFDYIVAAELTANSSSSAITASSSAAVATGTAAATDATIGGKSDVALAVAAADADEPMQQEQQ